MGKPCVPIKGKGQNHAISFLPGAGKTDTAWGRKQWKKKVNEITAIPKVLESIEIKGQVVTIDAMGTQTAIVETIRKRRADYVLAVKGNQGNLETDIRQYFEDQQICEELKKGTGYKKTAEKAHGQIEIREYYQTEETAWMYQKRQWKGLKSIGMEKKTIRKGETEKRNTGIISAAFVKTSNCSAGQYGDTGQWKVCTGIWM